MPSHHRPVGSSLADSSPAPGARPLTQDAPQRQDTSTGCTATRHPTHDSAPARHRSYAALLAPAGQRGWPRSSTAGTSKDRCRARVQRRHRREVDARCTVDRCADVAPSTPAYTTTCPLHHQQTTSSSTHRLQLHQHINARFISLVQSFYTSYFLPSLTALSGVL